MKRLEIMTEDRFSRGCPPLSAEVAVQNLSRYDAIWAAVFIPAYNRPAWDLLRQQYPDLLTLYYTSSDSTRVYDNGYFDYEYINTHHPEWFVLKDVKDPRRADPRDPDNRIRWSLSDPKAPNYDRFYLDVANPEFRAWAVQQIIANVSGARQGLSIPYHGLAADNVNIGGRRLQTISNRHPDWAFANRFDDWDAAFCKYLKTAKEALNKGGFVVVANHSLDYSSGADARTWELLLDSVDGVMTEQSLRHGGSLYAEAAWLSSMTKHERILDKGLIDWWVCYPTRARTEGNEEFLYYYCSWLLTKRPGQSLFFATKGDRGWSNPETPWHREYDLPVGEPKTPRQRKDACWAREYTDALVVVNPTRTTQMLRFDTNAPWIDPWSKQPISTLRMPRTSGRILVRNLRSPGRN